MNYVSVRIEGAILSPDILERLDDSIGQRPADFGLESSTKVKDEIARAWADAQDYWRIFQRKLETLKPDSPATTETRNHWIVPLLGLLGYQLEYQARGAEANGKSYPISHRVTNRAYTALHISGYRESAGLDRKPENAALRMSSHAMIQEYLNLSEQTYGIVTNGRLLRLLRDSSRLIKLSYLEFDLDRIFTDGLFADFAVLYRLLHVSRLPATHDAVSESLIERYHQDSLDSGARIRDGLSKAVEQAIRDFANGFLAHRDNEMLRSEIAAGKLAPETYYHYLLGLIYRLLFLMVIEERQLLFPQSAPIAQREIYERYYSVQRLRRLSEKRYLADHRKHDLWLGLMATFHLFEANGPGHKLGLLPLAGDLFGFDAIGLLAQSNLSNSVLLGCLRALGLYQHPDRNQLIRVNYAALNVEEFGSVYEGLLEFEPVFVHDGTHIEFAFKMGDQRANTGSHYTPDELVQPLIKHSLDILVAQKLKEKDPAKALLELRVADVACGSGHILLAAARRIATELAVVRTGEDQPSPSAFRTAIRDVIRHCIYGVDLNPLAVELCKVALWLEAHNPGEPLSFLDHHIKCGNAIVGYARREDIERGVLDEAFATMLGDDKEVASSLRKRNKVERAGQRTLAFLPGLERHLDSIIARTHELDVLPDSTPADYEIKKQRYLDLSNSGDAVVMERLASIPIAQFYIPKETNSRDHHVTDAEFRCYWNEERKLEGQAVELARTVADRKRFFHWFLAFPEVIKNGGFDCILGNPPYLGGQDLSGSYGHAFCHYVKSQFAPAGLSDLVVYFVRRIFSLLRPGGFMAFLTTNSIKDGDVRKDGLDRVVAEGGSINFAIRGIKWPGRANLVISALSIYRGSWSGKRFLDGKPVEAISAFLDDTTDGGQPVSLASNAAKIFQGVIFLGDGFLLTCDEASRMKLEHAHAVDVIFSVVNGQEINNIPTQEPGRKIINFFDWSLERAGTYSAAFERVERMVKPERLKDNRALYRERWWQYAEARRGMTAALAHLEYCFVAAATTKYLNFSRMKAQNVFLNTLYVFATDRWDLYAVVQSSVHEIWARKYSGSLETRLRYSPTDCFETFAFPGELWQIVAPELVVIGQHYHEHRLALMRELWLGLTDIYNLFHSSELSPTLVGKVSKKSEQIAKSGYDALIELRRLHVQLDTVVRDAYGWADLGLEHNFVEVDSLPENDRVRYTIAPSVRKEILRRLLELGKQRATEEAGAISTIRSATKARSKAKKNVEFHGDLFGNVPQQEISAQPVLTIRADIRSLQDGAWVRPQIDETSEVAAILAAILKVSVTPKPIRIIRLAVVLAREPRLLTPQLSSEETKTWTRLIGSQAAQLASNVNSIIPASDAVWSSVVRQFRGIGSLIEDIAAQTWRLGTGLSSIHTDGWPDGRVQFVLDIIERRNADEVVRQLPDAIRRWIDAKAA